MKDITSTLVVLAAVLATVKGQTGGLPYTPLSSTSGGASAIAQGSGSFSNGGFGVIPQSSGSLSGIGPGSGQHGSMQSVGQALTTSTGLGSTSLTVGMGQPLHSGLGTMPGIMAPGGMGHSRGSSLGLPGSFANGMSTGSGAMLHGHIQGIPQRSMGSSAGVFGHGLMRNTQTGIHRGQHLGQVNAQGAQNTPIMEGYVGAVGGRDGFPFMGGAGPNHEFSDGGESQGLGNGVGSGSIQAFMQRRAAGREDPRPLSGPHGPIYSDDMGRMGPMGGMGGMGGMGPMSGMGGMRPMGGMGGMIPLGVMRQMSGMRPMGGMGGFGLMGGMGGMGLMGGMGGMGGMRPVGGMGAMGGMGGIGRMTGMPGYHTMGGSGAMTAGGALGMRGLGGTGGMHGMGGASSMMG